MGEPAGGLRGWRAGALGLALLALAGGAGTRAQSVECSGHGHKGGEANATCVCDDAAPDVGKAGWTGNDCEIPVYGAYLDPEKTLFETSGCASSNLSSHPCGQLPGNGMECFKLDTPWPPGFNPKGPGHWRHLAFFMNRTSDGGDPDMYGLFTETPATKHPQTKLTAYDFRETSSKKHRTNTLSVSKDKIGLNNNYKYTYVCVHAYKDPANYTIKAYNSECPVEFNKTTGVVEECAAPYNAAAGDKHHSGCSEGKCLCKAPWKAPLDSAGEAISVYPNTGFDSCSSPITELLLPDRAPTLDSPKALVVQGEHVGVGRWNYYRVKIQEQDWQLHAKVVCDNCTHTGRYTSNKPRLYMKYEAPPGSGWNHGEYMFDFRPKFNGEEELFLDATDSKFRVGTWYIGVHGNGMRDGGYGYDLEVETYNCPKGCSGRGTGCKMAEDAQRNATRTCECRGDYFMKDCSGEATRLEYGQTDHFDVDGSYDYFQLPVVSVQESTRSVEVKLRASYSGYKCTWHGCHPTLLIKQGGGTDYPHIDSYTLKSELTKPGDEFELTVCASMLSQGVWRGAIYNPRSYSKIAYNVTAERKALCLNDCGGPDRGTCMDNGICRCNAGFVGGDCSVNSKCVVGSRKSEVHDQGTCWKECKCQKKPDGSEDCGYANECVAFECVKPKRWTGRGDQCVEDQCTADQLHYDTSSRVSCTKRCICKDGRPCYLDRNCDPSTIKCVESFNAGGKCVVDQCEHGSLLVNKKVRIDEGTCFSVCSCTRGHCEYDESKAKCQLQCNPSYEADDKAKACVPIPGEIIEKKKVGTPGWVVAVSVLFTLLVGAGLGLGAHWYYARHIDRQKRSVGMGLSGFALMDDI